MSTIAFPPLRTPGRRGRKALFPVPWVKFLHQYATSPLPPPPPSVSVPHVAAWGMDGNDAYGDCTIAARSHAIAAWNALLGTSQPVPTEADSIALYDLLTGCKAPGDANDTGLVETQLLHLWHTMPNPLFTVSPLFAWAPLRAANLTDIEQAIDNYGLAYVGGDIPDSAETEFSNSEPWSDTSGQPTGGHAWIFVGYDPKFLYAITWGGIQPVTRDWWLKYGDEAYALIGEAFVTGGYELRNINLTALRADLDLLNRSGKNWGTF